MPSTDDLRAEKYCAYCCNPSRYWSAVSSCPRSSSKLSLLVAKYSSNALATGGRVQGSAGQGCQERQQRCHCHSANDSSGGHGTGAALSSHLCNSFVECMLSSMNNTLDLMEINSHSLICSATSMCAYWWNVRCGGPSQLSA